MQNGNQTQRSNNNNSNKLDLQLIGAQYQKYEQTPQLYLLELISENQVWEEKPKQQIHNFLRRITSLYNPVPYHNVTHAFDVMIYFDLYLTRYGWQKRLHIPQHQRILMLIAAYAHDSGHQGLTNAFYKNSSHPWALASQSPLQNMHAGNLKRLFREFGFEIQTKMLQDLTQMILMTDNFYHGQLVKKGQNLRGLTDDQLKQPQNVLTMNCILLHMADLNNTTKETSMSMIWTMRLYQEFEHQNNEQQKQGLQLTCRGYESMEQRVSSNIIFFDHLVLPLFRTISQLQPRFSQLIDQIERNKSFWKQLGRKNGS